MEQEMTYKAAVGRLEEIVSKMQSNECDIDSLAGYTAEALKLLKFCKEKLYKTDEEVKKCLEELNS